MLGALLTLLVMGVVGVVMIGVVLAVIGTILSITFGIVGFLLFKVAPVLLIGWIIAKVIGHSRSRGQLASSDRKWLDG
jgi:hypothetical protein